MISNGRWVGYVCAVLLLPPCIGLAATRADEGAWRWVGRLASAPLAEGGQGLLDTPSVSARVTHLLTEEGRAYFNAYGPERKVQAAGRFLIVSRCRAEGCDAGRATLVLDTASAGVWFVTLEHGDGGASRCWRGTSSLSSLPGPLQRSLSE